DAARKALLDAMDNIVKEPPTKDEVERVRASLLRNLERSLSDPQSVATGALNTAIAQGDWRLMFLQHDRLKDIQPSDVVRVAKAYLKASNRTVGYYIPDSAPDRTVVPEAPDLEGVFRNYKSTVAVDRGETFDPTPANVEARVQRSKLANGMKLVILPKKSTGNMVNGTIELRFGDGSTLAGKNAAAQLAGSLLMQGTKSKTRQQLQDEMRKLDAQIMVSGGGGGFAGGRGGGGRGGFGGGGSVSSATATITAPPANFVAAMRLAVEMLKEPAYPEAEFDRIHTPRLRTLEAPQTEPTQLAAETLGRQLTPWTKSDVLYPATREEQLAGMKTLTLADVRKFHDQFYGANYGVLTVIGPADADAVKKAAAELLGS